MQLPRVSKESITLLGDPEMCMGLATIDLMKDQPLLYDFLISKTEASSGFDSKRRALVFFGAAIAHAALKREALITNG